MPPPKPGRKRNRKRKRRAASYSSSSSSSDNSSSEVEEQNLKSPPEDSSSSSSDDSTSSSESSDAPVKQQHQQNPSLSSPQHQTKPRHQRISPSPSPPPATLPSFIPPDQLDGQRNKEMQEKFRKFWLASIADGFKDDLEVIQKEQNMNPTKLGMLIDSLASGADVFSSSSSSKNGVDEVGLVLE